MSALDSITIKGFRSIRELENFKLNSSVNLFIGANGAGKSNLISFFRLYNAFIEGYLPQYFRGYGEVSSHLYHGRKVTHNLCFETHFGIRGHRFEIHVTAEDKPAVFNEARYYEPAASPWWSLSSMGDMQSLIAEEAKGDGLNAECSKPVYDAIKSW